MKREYDAHKELLMAKRLADERRARKIGGLAYGVRRRAAAKRRAMWADIKTGALVGTLVLIAGAILWSL
jgi:hypothetical protein